MRAALVVGIGLALVLATALWWIVGERAERAALPEELPVAAASEADAALVERDAPPAEDAALAPRSSASGGAPAPAREALDAAARPIRGRLIDAHCGRPIESGVVLELSSRASGVTERVEPGPGGLFGTQHAFAPARVGVRILEARSGEELLEHALVLDPREPVWTIRADLGLVIPLELSIPDGIARERMMAHVVEEGPDGPHGWIWAPVQGGERAFVHYHALVQRLGEGPARLEVDVDPQRGPGAHGEARLSVTHGLHAPLRVALLEETHAFGSVVDGRGDGVVGARVSLLPTAPESPLTARALGRRSVLTGKDGAFALEELEPGPHMLHVSSGLRAPVSRRLVLQQGANDLGPTVLASVEGWTVQGRVVDWTGWDESLLIALVEPESGRRWYTRTILRDEERERSFTFHDVPLGTYEMRPFSFPGVGFEPPSATVSPSSPEVEFRPIYRAAGKLVLRVLDGSTGAPLERFAVACRQESIWQSAGVSQGESLLAAERYVVWADGFQAHMVDVEALAANDGDVREAEVVLQRGWTELLVFADPEDTSAIVDGRLDHWLAMPISGVRVLAQDRELATSDADGLAVVALAEDPGDLAFELEGRHVLATERDDGLSFVWMIRTE